MLFTRLQNSHLSQTRYYLFYIKADIYTLN